MRVEFFILALGVLIASVQPAAAATCPKPELVRDAIALQAKKTGIDDDPIGGGVSSDPEWKVAKSVAGAFEIFGDGSTYITLQGVLIDAAGVLSCAYGFSEVSGLGFASERGVTGSHITLIRGVCRPASRRVWSKMAIGGTKSGGAAYLCNPAESVCEFKCR